LQEFHERIDFWPAADLPQRLLPRSWQRFKKLELVWCHNEISVAAFEFLVKRT
jgi:hypothetical protein